MKEKVSSNGVISK